MKRGERNRERSSSQDSNSGKVCFVQRHVSGRGNVATITDRYINLCHELKILHILLKMKLLVITFI